MAFRQPEIIFMDFPLPKPPKKAFWKTVSSGSLPYFLTQKLPENSCKVVLTQDSETAHRLHEAWQFFRPKDNALFFPDWETLPYEHFSPHQDLVSERLSVLWQLKNDMVDALFLPVATAMQQLSPVSFLMARTFWLKVGQTVNIDSLRQSFIQAGYTHVSNVVAAREFAIRGGIIDVFPMGTDWPFRLDLFDQEIDSIKTFDPDTQRTLTSVQEIRLLPAHEFPTDEAAQKRFRSRFRESVAGDIHQATVYKAVGEGRFGAGVEYYLPLFFEESCVTLFDYVGENALLVCVDDIDGAARRFWAELKSRFAMAQGDEHYPVLPPNQLFLSPDLFSGCLKNYPQIVIQATQTHALPSLVVNRQSEKPLSALQNFVAKFSGRILICAESLGRRETMMAFFKQHHLALTVHDSWQAFLESSDSLAITMSPLMQGFMLPESTDEKALAVICENDLYQYVARSRVAQRKKSAKPFDASLRDLAEIKQGDLVVHESHGIGRYQGLVMMHDEEMLLIEYANDAQLYIPVSQLHLISRYSGLSQEKVQLHKLGSGQWNKAKRKAAEKARDTAAELLNLYAQRALQTGTKFTFNEQDYQVFADGFGYEETEDQAAAIAAVIADLTQAKPMDRLVCGDVGFGKTEVALRAAFVAVMGGKQVAILAPTTLLVEQHAKNFAERFADFPVRIVALSRFNSSKETQAALAGMADGSVDIVIGTHKLVQEGIQFHSLGLVIIDEEHRFGVRQKEQLKRLRANVDVLTLTATPIPRTLSMALEGLRDFSLMTTAPSRRLAVKTFVKPFGEGSIREAVLRELKRGGQVFFLHNEVQTIANMAEKLTQLLPEARIGVAHGQLRERELEQVMRDFLNQKFNVLLCSTIIETGIDIPNANTIIINRADKFGIAQLHQLRGRVGRSHHQAYAYLLTPEYLTRDAKKRLDAIANADELGAGFLLAMQDLEIRGAGEILGEGQSGDMMQVGFSLYTEMLKQAVRDLRKGQTPDIDAPLGVNTEIKLHSPALLPENYCPDVHERLVLYKRLAACETLDEINAINEELVDRFGLPEKAVNTLLESHRLRLLAKALDIVSVEANKQFMVLTFGQHTPIEPAHLIALMQKEKNWRMVGADKLRIDAPNEEIEARMAALRQVLRLLKA